MAGEISLAQIGQALSALNLANTASSSAGAAVFCKIGVASSAGAGDSSLGTLGRKCRIQSAIWSTNGGDGGTTCVVRDAAGGLGNALTGTFHEADVAAPIVEISAGGAFDIDANTTLYANCSGHIHGYLLLICRPVA